MIDVHLLRYALAAAETGSFSRAAGKFSVKQSTLSKRIRTLELRLGLSLFDRSTQGVAPTAVGQRFLDRARAILIDLEALSIESEALAKGNAGKLRIGFQSSLAAGDLRAILEAYRTACPEVALEPMEGARDTLLTQIDRDRLDVAIVAGDTGEPGHRSLCLWSEPLTVAMARGHPLETRAQLYWTDLRNASFLVTVADPGPLIAAMIRARMLGASFTPSISHQNVSRSNLLSFAGGNCVAITAGAVVRADPAIVLRPVQDAFGPTRIDQVLHWREDNPNPALARFLALVAHRYGRTMRDIMGQVESERPPRGGDRDGLSPRWGGSGGANLPARI
ncbi:LysR family transcriptional regulator [Sphingomonas suaedae]|uniref:LysR family transcriptional regulator n=1 Tax=Sphingomonas suaedae TaxID=2599297 RepID=A0A518RHT3_9SPHN|nr:LysR family transcriptional regulator [Sphingomonas suaedae]QDX27027.1 LysR family transcriptional regulator [Sphingomonas suaedae]